MPIFIDEANGYYIGQVLPLWHPYALCQIIAIRRSAKTGPLMTRYMIDWRNDAEGTTGTFISWH